MDSIPKTLVNPQRGVPPTDMAYDPAVKCGRKPGQKQLQLGRVQVFALLPKNAPGQRIEFLAQERVFNAGLLQRFGEQTNLLLEQLDLSLQRGDVHLNCRFRRAPRGGCSNFLKLFRI